MGHLLLFKAMPLLALIAAFSVLPGYASAAGAAPIAKATLVSTNCQPIWIGTWQGTREMIFNRVLPNGNFDVFVGNLTCGAATPLLPSWKGNRGASDVTPSGRWVMLEVEVDNTTGMADAQPGVGFNDQLELYDRQTGRLTQLTSNRLGTIWAELNSNATVVTWSQMIETPLQAGLWNYLLGQWQLHAANISANGNITNERTWSYANDNGFYETYGFYNGNILFASDTGVYPKSPWGYWLTSQDQMINDAFGPGDNTVIMSQQIQGQWRYHEFQTIAPSGMFNTSGPWILTSILYNTTNGGMDLWRMRLDGSGLQRLTYFNGNSSGGQVQGFPTPDYSVVGGLASDPADSSVIYAGVSGKNSSKLNMWKIQVLSGAPSSSTATTSASSTTSSGSTTSTTTKTTTSTTTPGSTTTATGSTASSSSTSTASTSSSTITIPINISISSVPTTSVIVTTVSSGGEGGGGGGNNGGGGGGTQRPTVSEIPGGYGIVNFTQTNYVELKLGGKTVKVTENYITPSSAGVSFGNESVAITYNTTVSVGKISGQPYYIRLSNVSYLPIEDMIRLDVFTNVTPMNATAVTIERYNLSGYSGFFSTNILANQQDSVNLASLKMQLEIAHGNSTPVQFALRFYNATVPVPSKYTPIIISDLNISSQQNISIEAIYRYSCGVNGIAPYVYLNGSWSLIRNYSNDKKACVLSFAIPKDPIVGIFAENSTVPAATTQQAPSTSTPATAVTTQEQLQPANYWYGIAAVIVVAVIAALAYSRLRRPQRPAANASVWGRDMTEEPPSKRAIDPKNPY